MISHCTLNIGLLAGTSYAGAVYDSIGFQLTVYSFAWFQLFTIIGCGYAVVDHVRHLFETDPESRNRRLSDQIAKINKEEEKEKAKEAAEAAEREARRKAAEKV